MQPRGKVIACQGICKTAELVDLATMKNIGYLKGHQDFGCSLGWHPNSTYLATGSLDTMVRVWDIRKTETSLEVINNQISPPGFVKYACKGAYLLIGESYDYLHIYREQESYRQYQTIDYFGKLSGAALSPAEDIIFVSIEMCAQGGLIEYSLNNKKCLPETEDSTALNKFRL